MLNSVGEWTPPCLAELTLFGCVIYICCVGFASLMLFAMNLMIVPGMFVCSCFLISVCMFIVSKALLISSATVIVPFCYGVI